ncbi:uncharacterized protein MEPE_05393 [Melanopsichium pennsylvanicum]|uniref:Uncharacterized protein n=1 Tax=Melanopsichium pennsylvanicum TaxID=63383 RepID=A0AAJ5C7N0_9BASI|nr:uncharacterized protein MEPE_05393 [Melanopsichium pennsylvanicum]
MSSLIPITAGNAAADYTHKFKKHFGDRPTAFALSEQTSRASSSSSLVSSPSSSSPTNTPHSISFAAQDTHTLDPFGGSFSNTTQCSAAQNCFTTIQSLTAEEAANPGSVDSETHNTLANLGWRIRSRINKGYSRSTTSHDPFGGSNHQNGNNAFRSERDILANVTNTRRGWSRIQTAPTLSADFDGLRKLPQSLAHSSLCESKTTEMEVEMEVGSNINLNDGAIAKRSRSDDSSSDSDSDSEVADEINRHSSTNTKKHHHHHHHRQQQQQQQATQEWREKRIIKGMPKLSFSTSSSSSSTISGSFFTTSPSSSSSLFESQGQRTRSFDRTQSSASQSRSHFTTADGSPIDSSTTMMVVDEEILCFDKTENNLRGKGQEVAGMVSYDFSAHFNCTDF